MVVLVLGYALEKMREWIASVFENGTKLKILSEIYSQIKVEIFRIFSIEYKFACSN